VLLVLSELVLATIASRTVREFTLSVSREQLTSRAKLVARVIAERRSRGGKLDKPEALDALIDELGRLGDARITVVARDGSVLGDSEESAAAMVNHADRPEVKAALAGQVGTAVRWSSTLGKEMLYVALPPDAALDGAVVRTATPSLTIGTALSAFSSRLIAGAIAIGALGAALALLVSRRVIRPLEELEVAAGRFAAGDLSFRAAVSGSEETARLAQTINQMAAQLDDRFRAIAEQRNEQEAVLSSMVEGVLAVDADERVTTMNLAAGRLLGIEPHRALGRSIQEVTRNADVQKFVSEAGRSEDVVESELTLHSPDVRVLQGHGARIRDSRGRRIGTVVVLNDVTRMRQLETLRRDFVANVSHELKTPITSIKGFVATLLDGAMANPEDARRFLEIVARHADRLSTIIDDLLSLSRIEQEDQEGALETARSGVRETLKRAMDACANLAGTRQIRLALDCSEGLVGVFNARLVEQAVTNLIDNAIKYSEAGSSVTVTARRAAHVTEIAVRDHGVGIEAQHLDRLFERFYRVDKARSRKLGGTGLGLAIVKHIALAHGGTVQVESTPGLGSTFTLKIPDAADA
jgi:two-component system phosphate regulon sensor histidine kinase PhoR